MRGHPGGMYPGSGGYGPPHGHAAYGYGMHPGMPITNAHAAQFGFAPAPGAHAGAHAISGAGFAPFGPGQAAHAAYLAAMQAAAIPPGFCFST